MKRLLATTAIALSVTTAAQAASNITVMFAKDYWRVAHIARNIEGNPACMMGSQITFSDGQQDSSWVFIRGFKGGGLMLELARPSWNFSSDIQVPFSVIFDKSRREFFGTTRVGTGTKKRWPHPSLSSPSRKNGAIALI